MKTNNEKEKFIELRARGLSFSKIAEEIGVSKPILIKWNSELRKEMQTRNFWHQRSS
jgi:transposase